MMRACVWLVLSAAASAVCGAPLTFVDTYTSGASVQTRIAVQTCAGLYNRNSTGAGGGVFVEQYPRDVTLLREVSGVSAPPPATPISTFLRDCLVGGGNGKAARGVLRYNYTAQQPMVPVLLTLAAVLDAVPMEAGDPAGAGVPVVFDAAAQFRGWSVLNVTAFVYDKFGRNTTALAFMNPGYNQFAGRPFHPPLTGSPSTTFIDHIVKERLFNFYLLEACIPLTDDHALVQRMVAEDPSTNNWPRPVPSYGYDDTFLILGGFLFEAGATCVKEHNLGTIATVNATNLSFFSRKQPITTPLRQNPAPPAVYQHNTSYVALIVGDGDNVGFDVGPRFQWMHQRLQHCNGTNAGTCYPLTWTISPHLVRLAPDLLLWYFTKSRATGRDFFMLPPSGILYSYPAQMNDGDQAKFVQGTEAVARLLNTSATIDWETPLTWDTALNHFYPKYATNNVIRGVFPMNVPYMVPIVPFLGAPDKFIVVNATEGVNDGGQVVVFQPREWRGTDATNAPPLSGKEYYSPSEMAKELNDNPVGTVSFIYLTSDGGGNLSMFDEMVSMLQNHVQVVDASSLPALALQRTHGLASA